MQSTLYNIFNCTLTNFWLHGTLGYLFKAVIWLYKASLSDENSKISSVLNHSMNEYLK